MATQSTPVTSFHFDSERKGEEVIIHCHGRIVAPVADEFYRGVKALMANTRRVTLDLTDVSVMDSMGIGTCVRLYVSARSAGSSLQLINLAPRVRQVLGITNLLSILCDMCEKGVSVRF